jgi:hypothetical protein
MHPNPIRKSLASAPESTAHQPHHNPVIHMAAAVDLMPFMITAWQFKWVFQQPRRADLVTYP